MSKVAIIPLQAFLDAKADSELLAQLAASVERNAVLRAIDKYIATYRAHPGSSGPLVAMQSLRHHIAKGDHA